MKMTEYQSPKDRKYSETLINSAPKEAAAFLNLKNTAERSDGGEGRSANQQARMDYAEAFEDLDRIYAQYKLKKASLLAFSFGGLVAAQFAGKHPEKIASLILCSALVSQQKSYETILRSAREIYENKKDSVNFKEVSAISTMDSNSLAYRTLVFKHASANGFFSLSVPNDRAKANP